MEEGNDTFDRCSYTFLPSNYTQSEPTFITQCKRITMLDKFQTRQDTNPYNSENSASTEDSKVRSCGIRMPGDRILQKALNVKSWKKPQRKITGQTT